MTRGLTHGRGKRIAVRFYERFGAGDMAAAFECFSPNCIALTPSGALNNEKHEAAARALKTAIPDGRMELIRALESGDEVYITGRFTSRWATFYPTNASG